MTRIGSRLRRWRPSIQLYLAALLVLCALGAGALAGYVSTRNLDEARDSTVDRLEFQAALAAGDVTAAIEASRRSVAGLAANPSLEPLFGAPVQAQADCTLAFAGAGPFGSGHLDLIDLSGAVLCTSRERPVGTPYGGEPWLDPAATGTTVVGPVTDPLTERDVVVVAAPIRGRGVAATFLEIEPAVHRLEDTFSGPLDVRFTLFDPSGSALTPVVHEDDGIASTAEISLMGWMIRASVDESDALAHARQLNRDLLWLLVAGIVLLVVVTYLLYRALARPIARLGSAVRGAMADSGAPDQSGASDLAARHASGPAEVAALAGDFATLQQQVAAELQQRREAEADARASEERYRRLFESNPMPMWIYDVDSLAFLEVNDATLATYGYEREEILALTIRDIRPEEDADALQESVANSPVLERSGPWRHVRRDGELIAVEITSHAIDFDGHAARLVMAEDVTQRERTRRLLQRAERMESLGQLAGGMAHDFNNVLAVMLSYAEFAEDELADAAQSDADRWEPVLHDVRQIREAGQRAAGLTRQLLAFARGDTAVSGPLDLNETVSGIEEMLRRTLGGQVELDLSLAPGLWQVTGSSSEMEQVLVNLSVNARDAMPEGGRLLIETANVDVDEHHVERRPELVPGGYVRLRVSDNGVGMEPEVLDRVFEPFFTTKPRGSGTGFGLATVYGIVSRAGGTVHVYSEPGHGTSFSVLFPATDQAADGSELRAVDGELPHGDEVVLVVEDDENVLAVAERILAGVGYQVLGAPDGPTAIEILTERAGEIDVVLSDVILPGMLGSEMVQRLRQIVPDLRVLFMSGYAPPQLAAGGTLPVGASLVDKPFSAEELVRKVRQVLDAPPLEIPREPGS